MPHITGHLDISPSNLPTDSSDNLVEANIVLERVRPRNIVIEVVLRAHDETGGLIYRAADRFEASRYFYVPSHNPIIDAERKTVVGGVATDLRNDPTAGGGRIFQYLPTHGLTLAG